MAFVKAVKTQAKLRMAISGPSGSGKTYTALRIARGLGEKIALVDSEFGSASKYADKFDFSVNDISGNKHPREYIKAIKEAASAGFDVLVIDSITHAWESTKQEVDKVAAAMRTANTYTAWKEGTKIWDELKNAIASAPIHIIVTMRAKTEYVLEEVNGKKVPKKIGMAPEVRDGTEYEFDAVLEMTHDHFGRVGKTRCEEIDGWCGEKPGEDIAAMLNIWLTTGAVQPPSNATTSQATEAMRNAQKQEATEDQKRAAFNDAIKAACVRIGVERILEVVQSHGYDDPDQVQPKDFRPIVNAIKEIEAQGQQQ